MGQITKQLQAKHKETMSPWLKNFVEETAQLPLPALPTKLASFPTSWPFGRGDLYHWIPLLNRFDTILGLFCAAYQLNQGPQSRDFGCDVLMDPAANSTSGTPPVYSMDRLSKMGFSHDGDRELIEAVLKFTRMLLEHCGNRSIYASSAHLNDLLNTTSLSVLIGTLEVGGELAQRYQASVKRIGTASRQISTALLANHYNIDLDRVQQLALAFSKTPIVSLSDSQTPGSTSKAKDRGQGSSKTTTSMHANELVALVASDNRQWNGWGDVKVSYYPEQASSDQAIVPDQGRSSIPSTPTPLRRSATITTQHQTPRSRNAFEDSSPLGPRTPGFADESLAPCQKTFDLPQSVVVSTPAAELVARCPSDMPAAARYEIFHRIRVAKALLGSHEDRQQLLAVRLLAIINLAFIHTEANFVEKVLRQDVDETRRFQLVYQLAELIRPSADGNVDIPLPLQSIAFSLLEAVSHFQARVQDVLSALNANVNHGILLYVIRKAVAGMKAGDARPETDETETPADEWRNNLFSLTLHLSMSTRAGAEMVSVGLMDILVEILNIRTPVAQRIHSMVLAFLDGLIWTYQNAFTAFFSANGLDAVAKLVVDTVDKAQKLRETGHGILFDQKSSLVDYEIPYFQQQTLRWLLKFAHHIMSNSYSYGGNTDRLLRNLVDKSDLLGSLRKIIKDKKSFGSLVWTNTVTILSDFINNDPTSFAAISESGIIQTYLEAITGRPVLKIIEEQKADEKEDGESAESPDSSILALAQDSRPHPPPEETLRQRDRETLATGILPTTDAINVVPQVLNSISLNNNGLKMVLVSRAFESFFEIFESPAHVRCMEIDPDLANTVGGSFDELGRHHPPLRKQISDTVIDMVARIRFLGIEKAKTAGWGAKLLLVDSAGETVALDENGGTSPLTKPSDIANGGAGDMDVEMSDIVTGNEPQHENQDKSKVDGPTNSITPYIFALSSFLTAYISNAVLKTTFVEQGGIELLLDLCESPCLPTNFGDSLASRILNQVICQLVEHSPVRGLPSLLKRAQAAVDSLKPFSMKTESIPCYFGHFISTDLPSVHDDPRLREATRDGTKMVKALINAQTLFKILSDCFPSSRSNALQFYNVNVYDYYLKLVKSIGPLLRGVLAEEAGHMTSVPQHWAYRRSGALSEASPGDQNAEPSPDDPTLPNMLGNAGAIPASASRSSTPTPSRPTAEEEASARFRNYDTLRLVLHPMTPTTFPLFQTLGKVLLPRRERDPRDLFQRPRHLDIARALADSVLDQLRPSVAIPNPTSKDFHFWIIMMHTITEMLIDHPSTRPTGDRSGVQIIMPVLIAFKEQGGIDVLNSMLRVFVHSLLEEVEGQPQETSKAKVAAFGLKKILDLYFTLVNGKYLTETATHFGLQPRSAPDRSSTVHAIGQQLVLEFRAAITPEMIDLWTSPFVQKVPNQTVIRLLDILKIISAGENELATSGRENTPFRLLKYNDVRFNWRAHRGLVTELVNQGEFDRDLILEAVYRANGQSNYVHEYCNAHKAGLAGSRNPIPPEDADTSALSATDATTNERESSNGANVSEADRMSLDGPPDFVAPDLAEGTLIDNLAEITDGSSQSTDESGDTPAAVQGTQATLAEAVSTSQGGKSMESTGGAADEMPTKEKMNELRERLKSNLIERCLDVISAHPGSAIEVSELIQVIIRPTNVDEQDELGSTLTSALSSFVGDDEALKGRGKCIAAYAHLLALLLQDSQFFDSNLQNLRDTVEEYIGFLKTTPSSTAEEMPPYIPYILLVVEILLCRDERPVAAEWKAPKSLDDSISPPVVKLSEPLVKEEFRMQLLDVVLELLPRIGKEETLAVSALRVLVILTRSRRVAKQVGDKKNLQRLFLMAKQLAGSGSERLKQTKVTGHIMTILRHIVEDEDMTKQIMRAEIKATFPTLQRNRGSADIASYLRMMAAVALRAPELFVEVTNETVQFSRWQAASDGNRTPSLILKEQASEQTKDEPDETKQSTEDSLGHDVKQSTEPVDQEMSEAPRIHHESRRPVVENPDGVIHFLLCELTNYREVDDKLEPSVANKDAKTNTEPTPEGHSSKEETPADGKDKKPPKPVFKAEDHPIFVYRCFLLNCLTELLQSYTRTKVEFINFKRSAHPLTTSTPVKPRSSVLNYLIYDLLCQRSLSGLSETIPAKKRAATSIQTERLLVALVSKTPEISIDRSKDKFVYDDEPDLLFVRRFVLDTLLKAYERAPSSNEPLEVRYSRMQCLAELMNYMVGEKDKDTGQISRMPDNLQTRSQAQLRRLMHEKGYLEKLTASIAEINLTYPGVKRAIKYILRVLRVLTGTAKELSHSNILPPDSTSDQTDDDIDSTSSLSSLGDDREETPDLYRNSALGMLEPRDSDDDSDEDDEEDDEAMYAGGEYDDDEMDYGDDDISDEQDNISDDDEELSEMGEIEGLHGDPVMMDDDEDDESSDEDDEDDDEVESADMEDLEDQVEIVGEEPMDDDGNSDWESASHDEDEDEMQEGVDFDDVEVEVEEQEDAHLRRLAAPSILLDNLARTMMGEDGYDHDLMDSLDDHYRDDGPEEDEDDEDDEEMEDEEYIFDDYPHNDHQPPMPALGWDGLNPDLDDRQLIMMEHPRRRLVARADGRGAFPPGLMIGSSTRDTLNDFRSYFSRGHRSVMPQSSSEDGANPLLRRDAARENAQRRSHAHAIGLRLPEHFFGPGSRHAIDGPMGFLGELMEFLPVMNRHGPGEFHFQINGPGGFRAISSRDWEIRPREHRREAASQEPAQVVSFTVEGTIERYQEESRMIFGSNFVAEAAKLANAILGGLTPPAIEAEKKIKAEEAANQKRAEDEKKRIEAEQRLAKEAKEAAEKAEREKRETEEREAAERAALEAEAARAQSNMAQTAEDSGDSGAMEGVETTEAEAPALPTQPTQPVQPVAAQLDEPRVMTTIRGEEVDVTELGIDPDYLAALPEEFREEVIAQTVSTRRSQAREEANTGESTEVFQEFLDALPEELRLEIAQQERQEQRRRARDEQNRQAAASGTQEVIITPDMDAASILLTFPPALREQVLMDQGEELMDQLPPEMAAQARALAQSNHRPANIANRSPPRAGRRSVPPGPPGQQAETKTQRRTVVQMLDKSGIATLLRLMFITQQGSIRSYLFTVFADVCENRQNRLEVISTLLQILQDGSTDMTAVERSFGQLSLKARRPKDARDADQRTPQNLKRSLTTFGSVPNTQPTSETSPLLIVQQCLDLLVDLSSKNPHIPWLFLTEHEIVGSTLKRSLSRKGKPKDSKAHKYAINSLLSLLDRDLVTESSLVMTYLADLLNRVTLPLLNLDRRRKEAEDELEAAKSKPAEEGNDNESSAAQAGTVAQSSNDATRESTNPQTEAQEDTEDKESRARAKKEAAQKKLRQLQPPVIPPQNLTLAVRIFVARECSSKTFQNTISTIKNLSAIPGAKKVFGQELVHQARLLSENIVSDLDDLLPHIEKASSGTEIQGVALAKFSPGASEQNKLLRVLTALDHLFDAKKKNDNSESESRKDERQDLVTSLYHNSTFSAMWEKLSACLSAIRQRENMLNVATILLPLIESLMVVCKNTTTNDDPAQNKEMVMSSPPPESRTASLFFTFTEDHRRILNELVRNNPKLMSGTFALLVKNPKVLEFDNKRNYFNRSVHSRTSNSQARPSYPPLQLSVRREHVFHDSFKSLYFKTGEEMKYGKLSIRFHGEEGVDAGGVTREWFQVLSRQMFDPNYVLFIPVSSDRTTFHPNKLSGINDEHLLFFKFIGRIIGKALYEGRVLDCYFSRAVYKRILGKSVSVKDMESFDPDYYKSLCWMLDNDITDIITETFSVEDDEFGVTNVVDLIPNGREVSVTEENKHDYVRLVVEHKLLSSVKDQMAHFLKGFHEIIPAELIAIFNEQELELLISGLPEIDIDDWKSNTEYHNYNPSSQQIQWFWRAVRSFDKEERAKLLQFVTGTSKVPLNGFKELEGMNGVNRFNIHRDYGAKDRLPSSHTCFNQLDLPEYESYDALRSQIIKAITAGSEYFGFA